MNCAVCGHQRQANDAFCGRCGHQLPALLRPRRPDAINTALSLLGLCLVGAILGLVLELGGGPKLGEPVFSVLESFGPPDPEALENARRREAAMVVAVVAYLGVIAFAIWAMRAVEAARPVVRPLVVVKAGTVAALTAAYHLLSDNPPVVDASFLLALVGPAIPVLIVDAALITLLCGPASSRRWFAGTAEMMPVTPAPSPAAAPRRPRPGGPQRERPPAPPVPAPRPDDDDEPVTVRLAIPRPHSARHVKPEPQP